GITDPVDLRVGSDRGMVRVDEDHLVVLVRPVLADPIRVEDLQVRIVLRGPLLRDPLNRLRHRDLDELATFRVSSAHRTWPSPDHGRRKRRDQRPNTSKALAPLGPSTPRGRRSVCGCPARRIVQSSVRLTPPAPLTEPRCGTGTSPSLDYGERVARVPTRLSILGVRVR